MIWDVTTCSPVEGKYSFRNTDKLLSDYTASYPRRHCSSQSLLSVPEIHSTTFTKRTRKYRPKLYLATIDNISWNKSGIKTSDEYAFHMEMNSHV